MKVYSNWYIFPFPHLADMGSFAALLANSGIPILKAFSFTHRASTELDSYKQAKRYGINIPSSLCCIY